MTSAVTDLATNRMAMKTMDKQHLFQIEEILPSITPRKNPFGDEEQCSPGPVVLEKSETKEILGYSPVSVLCPGCGDVITRYRDGLPSRIAHFDKKCYTCETGLRRWSSVATVTALEASTTPEQLESITTTYWDRRLWEGIMTGESYPRTDEYTQAYMDQARHFGWDWEVTCPLCRRSLSEFALDRLDYHHWHRDPDQGICLCRACHEGISGGGRDGEQDWRAQQLGLKNKHDLQLTRLAIREQAMAQHETLEDLVDAIGSRYNPTLSQPELFALLSQTLTVPAVLDTIRDEYLFSDLPTTPTSL